MFEVSPSCKIAVPAVPAVLETVKGLLSCQHSNVDAPLEADIAVKLRYVGVAALIVSMRRMQERKRKTIVAVIVIEERPGHGMSVEKKGKNVLKNEIVLKVELSLPIIG